LAVLDSGINGKHPAFQIPDPASKARSNAAAIAAAGAASGPANTTGENAAAAIGAAPVVTAQAGTGEASGGDAATPEAALKGVSRVRKTFDFTQIREIVSNDPHDIEDEDVVRVARATGSSEEVVRKTLETISKDAQNKRPINWAAVEKLITIKVPPDPVSPHGTHVAGIIGADKHGVGVEDGHGADGMCPDIRIYDFRVLGKNLEDTEFTIIAALQYIRYVNERHTKITIHGANLSLSIPHNVHNYACGRTPVCNECERLIESGVVVVAAAGNHGYQKFETSGGVVFENYAAFSITDPGNADGVITVGSTHGNWPQTYGVSFFSSRGPTGDGRLKPDLVAPGERVQSTVLGKDWGPESGTSMAAPHVSGGAAMLLARYEELIGQPRRVKRILCESATDLGREKSFQGHGMLDVLRAFQSI
jgi:subtilisin family serine protease